MRELEHNNMKMRECDGMIENEWKWEGKEEGFEVCERREMSGE